ncbi:integrin alpha-M [Gastrophryne carolinensis]
MSLTWAGAFFVDTQQPITFQNADTSFGYQVVQLQKSVIVSAPLSSDTANRTGQLYLCDPRTSRCTPIPITSASDEDYKTSLGLALAARENPPQLLACGPTLQRTCGNNIYVNGRCYQLGADLRVTRTLPVSLPECSTRSLDIVFLIDGSGSIDAGDFQKMLDFILQAMAAFRKSDTKIALMQYSNRFAIHFDFKDFTEERSDDVLIKRVRQLTGGTRTSSAILKVMQELDNPQRGARANAEKVLIVITDGESINDATPFSVSIGEAERRGVRRFVIGVGNAFIKQLAYEELVTIASKKPEDHILKVTDFSALINFQKTLQEKIFAIEGTQAVNESSFQLEMSQEGFSAILTENGPILGAVGAHDWSGGITDYTDGQQDGTWINATKDRVDMKDAYMGYAVQRLQWNLLAIGAPRYQHLGSVFIYSKDPGTSAWRQAATVTADKIGSYFGSVLSVLSINSTQSLLVVGAPTYYSPEVPGGRVYLCPIITQVRNGRTWRVAMTCPETLQGDSGQLVGHFGSALSVLPDLTGDRLPDLAIGAPCEDDYRGAVYIFPGQDESFRTSYIQRISGRQLGSGIKYFGRSLSGNLDMTQDNLPDLTVGGEGRVLIVRSRPVLGVLVTMKFDPSEIPLTFYECSDSRRLGAITKVTLCFNSHLRNTQVTVADYGQLTYSLLLDAGRLNTRALLSDGSRSFNTTLRLTPGEMCRDHLLQLPECVEDSLSPLRVSVNFSLIGTLVLTEDTPPSHSQEISFEQNCGDDGECEDILSVNIGFTGVTRLVVGASPDVNVTVSVRNYGDDSFNARVLIPYPPGLSYRRVSLIKSNRKVTVSCSGLEAQRVLRCWVNRPLLRPNTTVDFLVSFHVSASAALGDSLTLTANVTSDNGGTPTDAMRSSTRLSVLYAVYVTITSLEESSKYQNFSSNSSSSIQHVYRVINLGARRFPFSVILMVPVRLGETPIWEEHPNISSSMLELSTCRVTGETPIAENFQEIFRTAAVLNCSVGGCVRAECLLQDLEVGGSVTFTISGSVRREWISQVSHRKILLQSSAEIRYDERTYSHVLEQSGRFTRAQAETTLELHTEYNYYPIIIGSSVGALVLLGLITAALYKLGFFKRQYKDMMGNPDEQPVMAAEDGGGAAAQ